MRTYLLYIKSHAEAPDYEDQCEASNKQEALDYFIGRLGKYGWSEKEILENMAVETVDGKITRVGANI